MTSDATALRLFSPRSLLIVLSFFLVATVFFTHRLGTAYLPTPSVSFEAPPKESQSPLPQSIPGFNPSRHGPWRAPVDLDPQIHGEKLSTIERPKPGPLQPYTIAPIDVPGPDKHAPWLAAVMCAPWDTRRRMMIRSSWMRLYRDVPFDPRFVIANPGPNWAEAIRMENATFGDMVVLDTIPEDDITANTVKTLVFFDWLLQNSPKKYAYVSKMDIDLWLNARLFWDRYLVPRLTSKGEATVERTLFGQLFYYPVHEMVFPHGSMYTITWDLVELLASLQHEHDVLCGEDMANTILLLKGNETANMVNMKGSEKFDFHSHDTRAPNTAWALSTTIPSAAEHALWGPDAIAVHRLKTDAVWFKVAECFDEQGIKPTPPDPQPKIESGHPKMNYMKSRFEAIPDAYWDYENGTWTCNGVWSMERGTDRNPDL